MDVEFIETVIGHSYAKSESGRKLYKTLDTLLRYSQVISDSSKGITKTMQSRGKLIFTQNLRVLMSTEITIKEKTIVRTALQNALQNTRLLFDCFVSKPLPNSSHKQTVVQVVPSSSKQSAKSTKPTDHKQEKFKLVGEKETK